MYVYIVIIIIRTRSGLTPGAPPAQGREAEVDESSGLESLLAESSPRMRMSPKGEERRASPSPIFCRGGGGT